MSRLKLTFLILVLNFIISRSQTGLDLTFGNSGRVLNNVPNYYEGYNDIALQSDNKILTVGSLQIAGKFVALVHRYLPNGDIDSTFASNGTFTSSVNYEARGSGIDVRSDGKILVTGYTRYWKPGWAVDMIIIRLKPNGVLDSTFATNGTFVSNISTPLSGPANENQGSKILKEQDSSIIIGGWHQMGAGTGYALFKIKYSGQFDSSFGNNGYAKFTFASQALPSGFNIQNDGKILITGRVLNTTSDAVTIRVKKNGNLDSTFGTNGIVTTNLLNHEYGTSVSQLSNGKILVSGAKGTDFLIFRLDSVGNTDSSFGNNGIVIFDNGYYEYPIYHFIKPDNSIYLMGRTGLLIGMGMPHFDYVLMNFTSQGKVDSSFATNGKFLVDFSNYADVPNCSKIQADGKILIAGWSFDSTNAVTYFSMTRIFNSPVGIKEINKKNQEYLTYPNPTSSILNISDDFQNPKLEIINSLGQTVLKIEFKNQIDVSELASGFYTLLLKDNSGSVITKKFVKE